ncbi:hypothetical protein [Haloplanus halophilus]|uniref:hypothetical protein n=1 Tax=Haloplanus halophilus TaxID=2949993 RepID=UPI00203FA10B|nr:hypothetical protein [Haloplanus sp. GDY1]
MSALQRLGRWIATRRWHLPAAGLAVVGEVGLRGLLGWLLSPPAAVLWPPVVTLVAVGRRADRSPRSLLALAVLGHLLAVPAGAALFLLVDTPVRAALYWAGWTPSTEVIVLSPLLGVALGTVVAWAVPATALGAASASVGTALRDAVGAAVERPRRLGVVLLAHLGGGVLAGGVAAAGVGAVLATRSVAVLAATSGGVMILWMGVLAALASLHLDGRPPDTTRPSPVAVGLALAVVVAPVVGAGVVRVGEHRPMDASPAGLPEDPGAAYATALSNTERRDHRFRITVGPGDAEPFVVEHRVDRTDRQYRQLLRGQAVGPSIYADTGTGSPPVRGLDRFALGQRTVGDGRPVRASPDYVQWMADYDLHDEGGLTPPDPGVEGWRVAERNDTAVVVELTDPEAVFATAQTRPPNRVTNVTAARVRAVLDAERGTVETITYRFEATVGTGASETRIDARVRYTFEVGIDVRRPEALGPRSLGEWTWKLFAY